MKKLYEYKITGADLRKVEELTVELCGDKTPTVKQESEVWRLWGRWKCMTDLFYFGAEVMGLREARDRKSKRLRLDPIIHRQMARHFESDEYTLQLWPRGSMKSCWLKFAIIQQLLIDPMMRQGLWTKTATLARKELKAIASFLEHPIIRYYFPEIPPRKQWIKDTADAITVWRPKDADYTPQEAQIEVWGVGGAAVGHHYDRHWYDDILDDKTIKTSEQIEKLEDWWRHVQSIKEVSAVEKMIGTRYHYHDLYGRIIEEKYFDKVVTKRAIVDGKSMYSFYTLKDLERIKKIQGEYIFSCQYQNEVVAMQDRIFVPPYPMFTHKLDKPTWYMDNDCCCE
jgi:hypothetical protein